MFKARDKELRKYNISVRQAGVLFVTQAIGRKATPAEISRQLLRRSHSQYNAGWRYPVFAFMVSGFGYGNVRRSYWL